MKKASINLSSFNDTPLRFMLMNCVLPSRFSCLASHSSVAENTHLSMMVMVPLSSADDTILQEGINAPVESRTRNSTSQFKECKGSLSDMMGCSSKIGSA